MKIIVGLGNVGSQFKNTRHNVGFDVVEKFALKHNICFNKSKHKAILGEGTIFDKKVLLVKPLTFMNLSGECVLDIFNFYKLSLNDIIVLCDDININLGDIRIRSKGSHGGQNGLKNIINKLSSEDFLRIRIGVGNKPEGYDLANYVLSKFDSKENDIILNGIEKAVLSIEEILKDQEKGIIKAMNLYNKKS